MEKKRAVKANSFFLDGLILSLSSKKVTGKKNDNDFISISHKGNSLERKREKRIKFDFSSAARKKSHEEEKRLRFSRVIIIRDEGVNTWAGG